MPLLRTAGLALLAFGAVYAVGRATAAAPPVPAAPESRPTPDVALHARLQDLHGAWDPRVRARITAAARRDAVEVQAALEGLLQQRQHALLVAAVEYAAASGLSGLRPHVAELARSGPARVRARAVRAAELLEPWSPAELAEMIASSDRAVAAAALRLCAGRADAPWSEVLRRFDSSDPEVSEAAIAAIPRQPPLDLHRSLWSMAEDNELRTAALALRALARLDPGGLPEPPLRLILARVNRALQASAIRCWSRSDVSAAEAGAVWELAVDPAADLGTRCAALRALEETKTFDAARVKATLGLLDPPLLYFAARCMLRAGDSAGIEVLADLATGADPDLGIAARRLLGSLSGLGPSAQVAEMVDVLSDTSWAARAQFLPPGDPLAAEQSGIGADGQPVPPDREETDF